MRHAIHIDIRRLMNYVAARLDQEDEAEIELQLVDCHECTAATRQLHELYWSVRSWRDLGVPADVYEPAAACLALQQAEADFREGELCFAARLQRWRVDFNGRGQGAVRIVVAGDDHVGRLATEGLDAICQHVGSWNFQLFVREADVRDVRSRGRTQVVRPLSTPSAKRVGGKIPAVRSKHRDPSEHREAAPTISRKGGRIATIRLDDSFTAHRIEVTVRIEGLPPTELPPLCLLREGPRHLSTEEAATVDGSMEARFAGVGEGEYVLQIEPSGAAVARH